MPRANNKATLPARPAVAPWTASRCNRTLRQVTTFVNRLEKWHKAYLAAQEEAKEDNCEDDGHVGAKEEDLAASQPDWLVSNAAQKRLKPKRTYLARGKKSQARQASLCLPNAGRPAEKTPAKKTIPVIPGDPVSSSLSRGTDTEGRAENKKLKSKSLNFVGSRDTTESGGTIRLHKWTAQTVHLAPEYERIMQTATSTIFSFLVATSEPKDPSQWDDRAVVNPSDCIRKGSRSLFDMCLHKLSKDMVGQQKQYDANNDGFNGQFDAIGFQLQELEDYFGDSKSGWPLLRCVTRVCGIHMVANLVEMQALPEAMAMDIMVRSYDSPLLLDIAPAILQALVNVHLSSDSLDLEFHDLPLYTENWGPTSPLLADMERHRMGVTWTVLALQSQDSVAVVSRFIRYKHLLRLLVMLCNGSKKVSHLPSTSPSEFLEAIYSGALSRGHKHTDLYQNLRKDKRKTDVVQEDVTRPCHHQTLSEGVANRLNMAFTVLSTTAHSERTAGAAREVMERISKKAQILYELDQDFALTEYQLHLMAHIFFSNMCQLVLNRRPVPDNLLTSFESLLHTIECCTSGSWRVLRGDFVITLLAQRLDSAGLQDLVQRFLCLDCCGCNIVENLLADVGASAAMDYAAGHNDDLAMLVWAAEVHKISQAKMERRTKEPQTPATRRKDKIAYRWDEAIEEWIAQTPETLAKLRRTGTDIDPASSDSTGRSGLMKHPFGRDHVTASVTSDYRTALQPIVNDSSNRKLIHGNLNGMKRKSEPSRSGGCRDDNHPQTKKPRRYVSFSNINKGLGNGEGHKIELEDESEDELSLLR
ncbi:hypothetical protein HRR83_004394 [Exophiala dermatitidis]|uniref:Uncharacterized protein n=2 Tax=Exophiala dermatitidis TaxID=5970 RepID=H6BQ39_EXODN|nr:uncharacterized protein HMPREF1120_02653 [Exophiala dermatitidis NIH/UT8656]KAJ4511568.1 hypothetical protein HRR73_006143 [Exophiala dermatitidis]EHY54485.1 hypothetical protein HMPREF1120_02653 [Exophiala dermatitidis NIH/UT8656]KAJ4517649.1 hypothetical protein HRR75_002867 [Exophiala dermatitidis]KAJ4521301.1 hypothetical protein HRR74_003124 [Exophiala dermatitidis]KAJ4541968.1 hypothetical protein HRR77_005859 [Exophiala dermatitidis]